MSDTVKKISCTVKKLAKVLTAEDLPLDIREMRVTGPKPSYKSYPNKEERLLAIQEFSPEMAGLVGELYKNLKEAERLADVHKKQVNDLKAQLEGERAPILSDIQSGAQTIFTTMERNGIAFNEYMEAFSVVGEYFLSLRKQTEQPGREIPPGDSAKVDFILKYLGEKLPEVLSLVQSALKEWEAAATVTSAPTQVPPGVGVMKMGSKKVQAGIIDWLKGFFRSFMSGSKKFQQGAEILKGLTNKLSVTASKKHKADLGDFTFTNYETKVVFLALSSLKNESLREAVIKDKDPNRAKSAARHLAAAGVQNQLGLDLINSALSHVKWDEINRALGKE